MNETKCSHPGCTHEKFGNNEKCIFHCEKTSWYEDLPGPNEKDKKIRSWEKAKEQKIEVDGKTLNWIEYFWKKIREEKMAKKDYNFSWFVFPTLIEGSPSILYDENENKKFYNLPKSYDFWNNKDELKMENSNFSSAEFLGDTLFQGVVFEKGNFMSTKFRGIVEFQFAEFINTPFSGALFDDTVDFSNAIFTNNILFKETYFDKIKFEIFRFKDKVNFSGVQFSKNEEIFFEGKDSFERYFQKETIHEEKIPKMNFQNVIFPSSVIFQSCNFSNTYFWGANIEKVNFEECEWKKCEKTGEIILCDEESLDKGGNTDSLDYRKVERIYTQLQKNFAEKGEISESVKFAKGKLRVATKRIDTMTDEKKKSDQMIFLNAEMKKRFDDLSLYNEADKYYGQEFEERRVSPNTKKFQKIFLWMYKILSDYNNAPMRIIAWLVGTILMFAFLYELSLHFHQIFNSCSNYIHNNWEIFFWILLLVVFLLGCLMCQKIVIMLKKTYENKNLIFDFLKNFLFYIVSLLILIFLIFTLSSPSEKNISLKNVWETPWKQGEFIGSLQSVFYFEETKKTTSLSWNQSIELSTLNTIPILGSNESFKKLLEDNGWMRMLSYLQKFFATILWALLILSLRRKFRRGGD